MSVSMMINQCSVVSQPRKLPQSLALEKLTVLIAFLNGYRRACLGVAFLEIR